MKRWLAVLLTMALAAMGCMGGTAEGVELPTLPAVGETVQGFEVKEIRDFRHVSNRNVRQRASVPVR